MWPLLERVGNPHRKYKVIHVAGTSGKTSTCYYISSMLKTSGKKTGLTVSPHILSITERVQINTTPLHNRHFCDYMERFVALLGNEVSGQSYFEFMILFALWVFAEEKVEYAVLETGLGGLLDSTNVVTSEDKICVITDIGYDHQHILGHTLPEIASQKAGIIHKGNHVISYEQSSAVMQVIKKQTKLKNGVFQSVSLKNEVENIHLPEYQKRNYNLAHEVAEYIAKRDGFYLKPIEPENVTVPGRMQYIMLDGISLLVDGAHNPQKMEAFVSSVRSQYADQFFDVVLVMRSSKDYAATIEKLKRITRRIICSEFGKDSIDSVSAEVLKASCDNLSIQAVVEKDIKKAIALASTSLVVITGSLYILSALKK